MSDKSKGIAALIIGKLKSAPKKSADDDKEEDEGSYDDAAAESAMSDFRDALKAGDDAGMADALRAFLECHDKEDADD